MTRLSRAERRLLADVVVIEETIRRQERERPQVAEYMHTPYGDMPAETWGSYLAMTNLPE